MTRYLAKAARATLVVVNSTTKRDLCWAVVALATFGLGYFHGKPAATAYPEVADGATFKVPLPYACELTRSQREQIPHQWHENCPDCRQAKAVDQLSHLKPPAAIPTTKRKIFTTDEQTATPKTKADESSPSDVVAKIKSATNDLASKSKPKVPVTGVVEIRPPPFGSEKVDPLAGKTEPNDHKVVVRDEPKKTTDKPESNDPPVLVDAKEYRVEIVDGQPGWEVYAPKDTQVWMDYSLFIGYVPANGHMVERYQSLRPGDVWKEHPLTFVIPGGKIIRTRIDLDGGKRTVIRIKK